MKEVYFHAKTLETIRAFSRDARREIGKALCDLQRGLKLEMPLSRPLPAVASGAAELRVSDPSGTFRTFYYVKSRRGILVFHAFTKKTQRTPP